MDISFSVSVESEEQTTEWEELLKSIALKVYNRILDTKKEIDKQKEVK